MSFPWWFCMFKLFGKQLLHGFPPTTSSPLLHTAAWAHLFRRRPKFNNPLSPLAHALRLFLNSQMLIRDKLATFPSSTSTVSALLTMLCCLYVCTSIPTTTLMLELFFSTEKRKHMPCLLAALALWQIVSKAFCLNGFYVWYGALKNVLFKSHLFCYCCYFVGVLFIVELEMERRGVLTKGPFKAWQST